MATTQHRSRPTNSTPPLTALPAEPVVAQRALPTLPPTASGPLSALRRHPLAAFVALTFVLTWLIEIPWVAGERHWLPFQIPFPLLLLMGWMPGIAAVIVAGAIGGRAEVRSLLRRIIAWRVNPIWYVAAILGGAVLWLGALAIDPLFGGSGLEVPEITPLVPVGLLISGLIFMAINSEEVAWRGFALPRLQARYGALGASLILGVIEGLFHLPLFFKPDSDQAAAGLPVFMLGSIAGVVLFTWLFNNTRGSVLPVMLFHSFINTWISAFPAPAADRVLAQQAFTAVLVVAALLVVVVYGPARVARRPAAEQAMVNDKSAD